MSNVGVGPIIHKTVFVFRLAYISAIEQNVGVKLPIILDSSSGKEVDPNNIKLIGYTKKGFLGPSNNCFHIRI